jgi:protein phosphatase
VIVLDSPEAIAAATITRDPLAPNLHRSERGPFDIIGDVHGCYQELAALFEKLGYDWREATQEYVHPDGRLPVFVGDLADRGPASARVLDLVEHMVMHERALLVVGNHDNKLMRWLLGRKVQVSHGLGLTIEEIEALAPEAQPLFRARILALLQNAPGYLLLDGGRLVVTHAGIRDEMLGRWNRAIEAFCLYGDVAGFEEDGMPIRREWAAARSDEQATSGPLIVYGHMVVPEAVEMRRTINIDTGCVFGGKLTALRYPEMQVVEVPAAQAYDTSKLQDAEGEESASI